MSTLIIISLLLLISLTLMEAARWQEKLAGARLQSEEQQWQLRQVIDEMIADAKKIPPHCQLAWNDLEDSEALLQYGNPPICVHKKEAMEVRYVVVSSSDDMLKRMDLIARINEEAIWQYFQIRL